MAKTLFDLLAPAILLSETHFAWQTQLGVIADAVARVADEGFFRSVGIADVAEAADRARIGQTIHSSGIGLTYWTSMVLAIEGLNLSSLNEDLRRHSVQRIKDHIEPALECGARYFAVLGGPDPGATLRKEATERLFGSLCELCEAAGQHAGLTVVIEPLDRDAHKNGLIGPTGEAVALLSRVREYHSNIGISWDSAHVALCGEDMFESLRRAKDLIAQIHLANAVLDRADARFGDHHMPIGPPGFLSEQTIAGIIHHGVGAGLFGERKPPVAIEVRTPEDGDAWQTAAECRRVLTAAWDIYVEEA